MSEGFTIARRDYSAGPWRIIAPNGDQLAFPRLIEVHGSTQLVSMAGHDTKSEAIAALGDYAWRLHNALENDSA